MDYSFSDYLVAWGEKYAQHEGQQRMGQVAFNVLHDMKPDLANSIRGRFGLDPGSRDEFVPDFIAYVAIMWEEEF